MAGIKNIKSKGTGLQSKIYHLIDLKDYLYHMENFPGTDMHANISHHQGLFSSSHDVFS